jgi:hypothetical protein
VSLLLSHLILSILGDQPSDLELLLQPPGPPELPPKSSCVSLSRLSLLLPRSFHPLSPPAIILFQILELTLLIQGNW